MKLRILVLLLLIQSCAQLESNAQEPSNDAPSYQWLVQDLITKWENNKSYTIEVLEEMPEKHYDFQPAKGMKTFREQASHITGAFNFQLEKVGHPGLPQVDDASKASILKSYAEIFDAIVSYLKSIEGSILEERTSMFYGKTSKSRILNLMDNHLAHHRGQMIVYLRLKGIKPPDYIGW